MIKVLKSGLYTTLQDKGRYGHRSKGVPVSGSMDQESARFANTILGNDLNDCIIEFTAIAPSLEFNIATQIAVTGAKLSVFINGKPEARNCLLDIKKGDILTFSSIIIGWRGYIAVKNGFDTEVVLNSKSQYKGLTVHSKIEKETILFINTINSIKKTEIAAPFDTTFYYSNVIEVYKGPEFNMLSQEIKSSLLENKLMISPSSNRMAVLLETEIKGEISEIITAPVQPGTIQLTPSGKLIILMRDAQTSGGYARVFQCTEKSINILAQKRPNELIYFKLIP